MKDLGYAQKDQKDPFFCQNRRSLHYFIVKIYEHLNDHEHLNDQLPLDFVQPGLAISQDVPASHPVFPALMEDRKPCCGVLKDIPKKWQATNLSCLNIFNSLANFQLRHAQMLFSNLVCGLWIGQAEFPPPQYFQDVTIHPLKYPSAKLYHITSYNYWFSRKIIIFDG